jgi:hypothetical protein
MVISLVDDEMEFIRTENVKMALCDEAHQQIVLYNVLLVSEHGVSFSVILILFYLWFIYDDHICVVRPDLLAMNVAFAVKDVDLFLEFVKMLVYEDFAK